MRDKSGLSLRCWSAEHVAFRRNLPRLSVIRCGSARSAGGRRALAGVRRDPSACTGGHGIALHHLCGKRRRFRHLARRFARYMTHIAPAGQTLTRFCAIYRAYPCPDSPDVANPLAFTRARWRQKLARSGYSPRDHVPLISQFAPDSPDLANPLAFTRDRWRHKLARSDESPLDNAPLISQFAPDSRQMATSLATCRRPHQSPGVRKFLTGCRPEHSDTAEDRRTRRVKNPSALRLSSQ